MKLYYFFFLGFFSSIIFGQNIPNTKKGFITLTSNQTYQFTDLKFENNQISFINVKTKTAYYYLLNTVKLITDEEKAIIYQSALYIEEQRKKIEEPKEEPNDGLYRANYPEGIYYTVDDFLKKIPNETTKVDARELIGFDKELLDSIEDNCFFYYQNSDSKVKKVFAISYKGHLYFQTRAILSNRNKDDNAQTNDFPNSFVRVKNGGENYLYLETRLVNKWAQGFAYGGVGGTSGYYLATDMTHTKGIIWDFKNKEFNIFKNCKDYNRFIEKIHPGSIQKCENQQPDIEAIRKTIEIIK